MYIGLNVKYPLLLSDFNETLQIYKKKKIQILNFMEICLVGAEFFHAEGRTGRYDEANSWFHNFAISPDNKW